MFAIGRNVIAPKRIVFNFARAQSTSTEFKHLITEQKGATLYVTMNRPDLHNAFNEEVIAEITKAFKNIATVVKTEVAKNPVADASTTLPRSVVLAGNGPSFSAGAGMSTQL